MEAEQVKQPEQTYLNMTCKHCGGKLVFHFKRNRVIVIDNNKDCVCEKTNTAIQDTLEFPPQATAIFK